MDRTSCIKCPQMRVVKAKESGNVYFYCTFNKHVMGRYKLKTKYLKKPVPTTELSCAARKKPFFLVRVLKWIVFGGGTNKERK